jgi:hypothetical protein
MEELKVDVGDWVVLKTGRIAGSIVQITSDDMPDVPYENIERHATKEEILRAGGTPKDLEKKIYVFVPYNISDKQKGIQALHGAQKYDRKYEGSTMLHDFIDNHMTCIMLDGGTTNSHPERLGTLNLILLAIVEFNNGSEKEYIPYSFFEEPDINDALTAVAFIADERVFDFKTYPEFYDWYSELTSKLTSNSPTTLPINPWALRRMSPEEQKELLPDYYKKWVNEVLGGDHIELLRNLIRGKKLA